MFNDNMQTSNHCLSKAISQMKPNILFFNEYQVSPTFGGIERVTAGIATFLIKHGYNVYNAFVNRLPDNYQIIEFCDFIKVDSNNNHDFVEFLEKYNVDIILLQNTFKRVKYIESAIKICNREIIILFTHHGLPECEFSYLKFYNYRKTLFNNPKNIIRDLLRLSRWIFNYPLTKKKWQRIYHHVYKISDYTILLSPEYIKDWIKFAHLDSSSKFKIIPNPRTYDDSFPINQYTLYKQTPAGEGRILIVARLEEGQKKLSIALEIFKRLQRPKWHLYIVGDGPDLQFYRDLVKNKNIINVHFEGMKQPLEYYKSSSIFMMTSEHEAFPLTLFEAQQMGCIPIAFNTFGAVNSIIKNRETGFITPRNTKSVKPEDIDLYVSRLRLLIDNPYLRKNMAIQAIKHSEKYSMEQIMKLWKRLFEELTS